MANISGYLNKIKTAVFGKDVRGSLADGLDAVNKETESATTLTKQTENRQTILEKKYNEQIANATDITEIKDFHVSGVTGKEFQTMGLRGDDFDRQLAEKTQDIQRISQKLSRVSVTEYGVNGDGTTEDLDRLKNAISALKKGGTLYFPFSVTGYKIDPDQIFFDESLKIEGDGKSTVFIPSKVSNTGALMKFGRSSYEPSALTGNLLVNAKKGDISITVSTVEGISKDDYLLLTSDEAFSLAPNCATKYKGEILRVRSVDTAAKKIRFYTYIQDNYSATSNGGYKKLKMIDNVVLEKVAFDNPYPNQTNIAYVAFSHCVNVTVRDVFLRNGDMAGISFENVVGGVIDNAVLEDFTNNDTQGRYGYGIQMYRATKNVRISNCMFRRCRHGFTTDAQTGKHGVPRHITLVNCQSEDGSQANFDTHQVGEYITFIGCIVSGATPNADPYGTTYGQSIGFQLRCRRVRMVECEVNGADYGVWIDTYATGVEIKGGKISDSSKNGVRIVENYTVNNGNVDGVKIEGLTIIFSGEDHIKIPADAKNISIKGGLLDGAARKVAGRHAIFSDGENVRIIGVEIIDTTGAVNSDYGIYFGSLSKGSKAINNVIIGMKQGEVRDTGTDNRVMLGYISRTKEFNVPGSFMGGSDSTLFDISTDGSKKMRLQRYSKGEIEVMFGTADPVVTLHPSGNIELHNPNTGIILKSNLGKRYLMRIDDNGNWTSTELTS